MTQVRFSMLIQGRGYADDDAIRLLHRVVVDRRRESARLDGFRRPVARYMTDIGVAPAKGVNFRLVRIHRDYPESRRTKMTGQRQTDITKPDNADHGFPGFDALFQRVKECCHGYCRPGSVG